MSNIEVPSYAPIAEIDGGWDLYQLPRPKFGSPLWVELKLVNQAMSKHWGANRSFRLCWGVDAGRLRQGRDTRLLQEQQPAVYEALLHFLSGTFTVARLESNIGSLALHAERVRVAEAAARRAAERKASIKRPDVDPFS